MNKRLGVVCGTLFGGLSLLGTAAAQPIPTGGPGGDHAPGQYPTTVTAANVNAALQPGGTLGGAGSDDIRLSFPSAGPVLWTSSRFNEGDIALSIGPRLPADPSFYPPNAFLNYAAGDADNTTQAWRVNQRTGALLASVRHNGVNNGDSVGAGPVGVTRGVAYFNQTGAQGVGYRMNDGVYSNGGEGTTDLQLGFAGPDDGLGEAVFNTAVAYFPYEQGWLGAWVLPGSFEPGQFGSGSPGLEPTAVEWVSDLARVTLPGVNSATDGMLFVASTDDSNATNITAAMPSSGGWLVASREDSSTDATGQDVLTSLDGNDFQFLYVPYTASNLIGGHIAGNGTAIHEEGGDQFSLTRTAAGTYELTVFESDLTTKRTESDGILILSVAGAMPSDPSLPDRTYLSYQYDAANQKFVIQSRETLAGPPSDNVFGSNLALRDTDFYFAWVDFEAGKTIGLAGAPGDFDNDGDVDGADLDVWEQSFAVDVDADADGDGDSDGNDFLVWQQNFTGAPATGAASAIPEPAAAMLALFGGAALAAARKRVG
jgi:hypothetical protein